MRLRSRTPDHRQQVPGNHQRKKEIDPPQQPLLPHLPAVQPQQERHRLHHHQAGNHPMANGDRKADQGVSFLHAMYKKGKRRFKLDLIHGKILIARYFVSEQITLETYECTVAEIEQQRDEQMDEQSGEEGLLAEVIEGEGEKRKITAKALKTRLKEISPDPVRIQHKGSAPVDDSGFEAYNNIK